MMKSNLLTGASALVAALVGFAGSASATVATTHIYGGGSSLISPFLRQVGDCYGNKIDLNVLGTILSGATSNPGTQTLPSFNFTGVPAHDCAAGPVDATKTVHVFSTGSGAGINGFYSHDAKKFWGATVPGDDTSAYPAVSFAVSDYGLNGTDAAIYATGGTEGSVTVAANPTGSQYPLPGPLYGAQIQVPILVVPVALAYDPVYKKIAAADGSVKSYKFALKTLNKDGSGGLVMKVETVCAIFNGALTNWNDPALKALNGNKSLRDPTDPVAEKDWSVPIEFVGRKDSSGTNSIFYRALAAQCSGTYNEAIPAVAATKTTPAIPAHTQTITYTNRYLAAGSKTTPAALQGATYTGGANNGPAGSYTQLGQTGKYTLANLSNGIADYVAFNTTPAAGQTYTQGRIGYLSPDFALPAVVNSGANTYGLNVVNMQVGTAKIEPTGPNAVKAFGTGATAILPPQSSSTGAYQHLVTNVGLRTAPQDWAEPLSTTLIYSNAGGASVATPLANPTLLGNIYPFVGTTDMSLYTCYATADSVAAIKGYLAYYLSNPTVTNPTGGLLGKSGFAAMPKAWTSAITTTFLVPAVKSTATAEATAFLNLFVDYARHAATPAVKGTPAYGGQCASVSPGA